MRRVPTAVTVVTARSDGDVRGMTVGSFTSVSMEPLLVSFNVGKNSGMHAVLLNADHFYVHLLAEEQSEMSNMFANPELSGEEQFSRVAHVAAADGAPILSDTLAYLRCEKIVVYDAGDHCLMIGRVDDVVQQRSGRPLIYYDRGYRTVGPDVTEPQPADISATD